MDRDALIRLRDAVKAERLTTAMCEAAWPVRHEHRDEDPAYHAISAYMGYLDAAFALHEAALPGWDWSVGNPGNVTVWRPGDDKDFAPYHDADSDTAARAWLLAIIEALIAETPE